MDVMDYRNNALKLKNYGYLICPLEDQKKAREYLDNTLFVSDYEVKIDNENMWFIFSNLINLPKHNDFSHNWGFYYRNFATKEVLVMYLGKYVKFSMFTVEGVMEIGKSEQLTANKIFDIYEVDSLEGLLKVIKFPENNKELAEKQLIEFIKFLQ
ncbi:hypothetical protein [Clostridium tarantellae]|uniref:Uncharacterized protein n=1 Tax=Clostridium tarantellae TaxID=39493 RepID=A0A6I1MNM9_9CLOT|nr:hypothetical protein [Clostridium tarantellae]MPQ45015.1 hypothetical protein [Clostridium tarantellae]